MRILVTGGAGFIGSRLCLRLSREGHEVTVLDCLSRQVHGVNPAETSPLYRSVRDLVRMEVGSVGDEQAVDRVLEGQEAIVHLAAETGTGQSMYEIKRYIDVNIGGTGLILDRLARGGHSVRRFVVASSRAIYGEGRYRSRVLGVVYPGPRREEDMRAGRFDPLCPATGEPMEPLPTDEDSKIHPSSVYGITKQNQEQLVLTVCPSVGIDAVALRYQNVYGPGQSLRNPYTGILSIFSTRIKNGNPLNIFEDGRETRDFVHVDDVVEATFASVFSEAARNQVVGVGSGCPTDVMTVARTLVDCYQVEVPIQVTGTYRLGDIRHNFADLTKARRVLGFEPRVAFSAGIRDFARWVDTQPVPSDAYEKSLAELKSRGLYK